MSIGNDIIFEAQGFLGVPYVWGGESMTEGGFDCSGFVYNVLNKAGIKVSRLTAQGYFNTFKNNKCTKDVKGALLFFGKSTSNITHIAISNGDDTMYESIGGSKNTKYNPGKGVSHTDINRRNDLVAVCAPFEVKSISDSVTSTNMSTTIKVAKPTLRRNNKNSEVKILQSNLNKVLGIKLVDDGIFGSKTESALYNFQSRNKLAVDGIYGPKSYKVMCSLLGVEV
jgi:hypothetical protein